MDKTSLNIAKYTPAARGFLPAPAHIADRSALLCAIELEIPLHQVVGIGGNYAAPDPRAASRDSMAHPAYRRFLSTTRNATRKQTQEESAS